MLLQPGDSETEAYRLSEPGTMADRAGRVCMTPVDTFSPRSSACRRSLKYSPHPYHAHWSEHAPNPDSCS